MPGDITLINTISIQGSGPAPIVRSNEVLGGAQNAATLVDRDAIPSYLRQEGMYVYVVATAQTFQLIGGILNANWVLVSSGTPTLQAAYDGGNTILLAGALPVAVTNPAASATAVLTLTQGTAGQNVLTASGGNIDLTGGNYVVNTGQKVLGAAELSLDGTTVVNLQTGATTRWQVQAAPGHLVPQADNAIDIGVAATNRIRTLYAGTSVVVGATVTINGTTNTISSSANLTLDTAAAGTLNLGTANASTVNIGTASGAVVIPGNLTVNGTTTTINTANLTVTDPIAYFNNGVGSVNSGIAFDRPATTADAVFMWNNADARFELGTFDTVGGTVVPTVPLAVTSSLRAGALLMDVGTDLYLQSNDGSTAAVSPAGQGRLRYLNGTGWQVSSNAAAYQTIATTGPGGTGTWANVLATGNVTGATDAVISSGQFLRGVDGATGSALILRGGSSSGVGTAAALASLEGGIPTDGNGGAARIRGSDGVGTNRTGGGGLVFSGAGTGSGSGGLIQLFAGTAGATGIGGAIQLQAGAGGATSGNGGAVSISSGIPVDGDGGAITITASSGAGTNRAGGSVSIAAGSPSGTGVAGNVSISAGAVTTATTAGSITIQGGNALAGGGWPANWASSAGCATTAPG